jgi:hypothetical protein
MQGSPLGEAITQLLLIYVGFTSFFAGTCALVKGRDGFVWGLRLMTVRPLRWLYLLGVRGLAALAGQRLVPNRRRRP